MVAGVARVGRAEGEEEDGAARRRKKKMRLTKICADTKFTILSGKRTRLEYTFFWLISWPNETLKEHCESVRIILYK